MPIEVGIWRLTDTAQPMTSIGMDSEKRLEQVLTDDISVADPGWLLIGRQVRTDFGTSIDLLAMDSEGQLVVLELKRNKTPREVVAQLLDYGSWVRELEPEDVKEVFEKFAAKSPPTSEEVSLETAFCDRFGTEELPDSLNKSHKLVLVASELDESSERIIRYLAEEYGVSINAVFFQAFRDGDREYLSRAWLTDPEQVEQEVAAKREKLPWNGEFYVSFGEDENRRWDEAMRYGFISAGGGTWHSRTLETLETDGRVWANIPGCGYVGVGIVKESVVPIDDFKVDNDEGTRVPIRSLGLHAANHITQKEDPDKAEHFVRIEWIHAVPKEEAVKEKGFFGNQNSAARPRAKSWAFTIDRLKKKFKIPDSPKDPSDS